MLYPEITRSLFKSKGMIISPWELIILRREIPLTENNARLVDWYKVTRDLLSKEDFRTWLEEAWLTNQPSFCQLAKKFFSLYYRKASLVDKMVSQAYKS